MINLLLGPPGAGKSYEAVVFHVLPALEKGRKVITNLPLNLVELGKLDSSYPALIEIKVDTQVIEVEKNTWNPFHKSWDKLKHSHNFCPFASILDYGDSWRHPDNGGGALYVIDECHKPLPSKGTQIEVEQWFAEHRHEYADVLLITQSSGKICKAITDSCQVVYRVKKAVALGSSKSYIRKVQDGLRGEVVNEAIRRYKPEFFKYYNSHTKSGSAGEELGAVDIVPFWKRWPVIGAGVCFVGVVALSLGGHSINPMKVGVVSVAEASPSSPVVTLSSASSVPGVVTLNLPVAPSPIPAPADQPFAGLSLHIVGFIESSNQWRYSFNADQNGQPTFYMKQSYLEESGYTVERLSPCSAKVSYKALSMYVTCNTALTGIAPRIPFHG